MRFVHLSDVHWGMHPDADKPWSIERANDIKKTFARAVAKAKEIQADLMFISGDLFHHPPLLQDLQEVNSLFNTIPYTGVIIVAGANDKLRNNSYAHLFNFSKNVHYITSEDVESIEFPDFNVCVHAFSYYSNEIKANKIDNLNIPEDGKTHIVVAYGGDTVHMPIDVAKLTKQNVAYYALGSVHTPTELVKKRIIYPGTLEPIDIQDQGDRGIYIGDINTLTKEVERVYFTPMSTCHYIALTISINTRISNEELNKNILNEITKRGINNIYRLRLVGYHDPEQKFDFLSLEQNARIVDIIDESEPEYNLKSMLDTHSEDIIGSYIKAFQREDLTDIDKKALYYGIKALTTGEEVK